MHSGTHVFLHNPANLSETLPSNAGRYHAGGRKQFLGAFHPTARSTGMTHLGAYGVARKGSTYLGAHLGRRERQPWGARRSPHGARLSAGVHESARIPWGAERNPYGPRGGLGTTGPQMTLTYEQFMALQKEAAEAATPGSGEQVASIITAGTNTLATLWGKYQEGVDKREALKIQRQIIAAGIPVGTVTPGFAPPTTTTKPAGGAGAMMLPLLAVGAMMMMR